MWNYNTKICSFLLYILRYWSSIYPLIFHPVDLRISLFVCLSNIEHTSLHLILDFSILVIKKDEKMFRKISFIYPPKRIILGINIKRSWNFLERNWPDISKGVIVRLVSNDSSKVSNLYRPLLSSVKKTTQHWPRLTFQRLKTDQLTPCSFVVIHSSPRTIQY